MDAYLLFFARL